MKFGFLAVVSASLAFAFLGVGNPLGAMPQTTPPSQSFPKFQIQQMASQRGVRGRLAFPDWGTCNPSSGLGFMKISPEDCQAFKRRFDSTTGVLLSGSEDVTNALHPLSATVEVSYTYSSRGFETASCPVDVVTSDRDGFFAASPKPCFVPGKFSPWRVLSKEPISPEPDRLKIRVRLLYPVEGNPDGNATEKPTIRALWPKTIIEPYYAPKFDPIVYTGTYNGEPMDYVYPVYDVIRRRAIYENSPKLDDLGVIILPDAVNPSPTIAEYLKMGLLQWQTLLNLHVRFRDAMIQEGVPELYFDQMFLTDPQVTNCDHCYSLIYASDFGSFGKDGMMFVASPRPVTAWTPDSAEVLTGHEFGHSIHYALAPPFGDVVKGERRFLWAMKPDGTEYYRFHGEDQIEDMNASWLEGTATAMGHYLVDGCRADWNDNMKKNGFPAPYPTMSSWWNLNPSCGDNDGCEYNRFRWHMVKRGIAEGSDEWNRRLGLINAVNAVGYNSNKFTSNNEARYALFLCDLLTDKTDITHTFGGERMEIVPMSAQGDHVYLDNYLSLIGRALDGISVDVSQMAFRTYSNDVLPKDFHISFPQFLDALGNFCAACRIPNLPVIGDPAYSDVFLSAHGPMSEQSLGLYMVNQGWLTEDQLNNVLRADFMEEVLEQPPWSPPPTPMSPQLPAQLRLQKTPFKRMPLSKNASDWLEEIHRPF